MARVALLLFLGMELPLAAQVLEPQTGTAGLFGRRPSQDPNRTSQDLIFSFDASSGYDRNHDQEFRAEQTGVVNAVNAVLHHRLGHATRFIESSGHAYVSYATVGIDELAGGSAEVRGQIDLSRRTGLIANFRGAYEPTVLFNAYGPIADDVTGGIVPGSSPSQGIADERWLALRSSATLFRNWTPRQRTDFEYGASRREPVRGVGLDSDFQSLSARHRWNPGQSVGLGFYYRLDDQHQVDPQGNDEPLRKQAGEVSLSLERRLSPTQRLSGTFGGGATHARTLAYDTRLPYVFVVPTVFAGARLDVAREWTVSADARRDVAVLQGIAPEPFVTNALSARLDGRAGERIQMALSGSLARGTSRANQGAFDSSVAVGQFQYALARSVALFASYSYYAHHIRDSSVSPPGFPTQYQRNSARFGATFWLPLYGRF